MIPAKLYKYKPFDIHLIESLSRGDVYYADPTKFNDPLDSNPQLKVDSNREDLEKLWWKLSIQKYQKDILKRMIDDYRFNAMEYGSYNDDEDGTQTYIFHLVNDIKERLDEKFRAYGVLSLAKKWNCPLMWSHYADQHKGVAIEYSTIKHKCTKIDEVRYDHDRYIYTSDLITWQLKNDRELEQALLNKYFYAKAPPWRYEKEWRVISDNIGDDFSPFKISAIYFGLRCSYSIVVALVKLFSNYDHKVNFYSIYAANNGFGLKRREIDIDEIEACGVRSSPVFAFDDFDVDKT